MVEKKKLEALSSTLTTQQVLAGVRVSLEGLREEHTASGHGRSLYGQCGQDDNMVGQGRLVP